jgi:hypothetical protein
MLMTELSAEAGERADRTGEEMRGLRRRRLEEEEGRASAPCGWCREPHRGMSCDQHITWLERETGAGRTALTDALDVGHEAQRADRSRRIDEAAFRAAENRLRETLRSRRGTLFNTWGRARMAIDNRIAEEHAMQRFRRYRLEDHDELVRGAAGRAHMSRLVNERVLAPARAKAALRPKAAPKAKAKAKATP